MDWSRDWKKLTVVLLVFLACYWLPVERLLESGRLANGLRESLYLVRDYARHHVLLCLLPAFFIAGAITIFLSSESVTRYLGAGANRVVAYAVASVSGMILSVCSCTVLPLFAGIYRMGAGIGPACAFLYAGPAINVLAIIFTLRLLGPELGIARAVCAVFFSVVIGLLMQLFFGAEEGNSRTGADIPAGEVPRPLWQNILFFGSMVGFLLFANFPYDPNAAGLASTVQDAKWMLASASAMLLAVVLVLYLKMAFWKVAAAAAPVIVLAAMFPERPVIPACVGMLGLCLVIGSEKDQGEEWLDSTWGYTLQMLPLLFWGVLVSGALFGREGYEGMIPREWIAACVGGNSISANFFASISGAFMYFSTLMEVPIIDGLRGDGVTGMGKGPALALLLSGPALSLPNMMVISSVMGARKTFAFCSMVVVMATLCGFIFGMI